MGNERCPHRRGGAAALAAAPADLDDDDVLNKVWLTTEEVDDFFATHFRRELAKFSRPSLGGRQPRSYHVAKRVNDASTDFNATPGNLLLEAYDWVDTIPLSRPRKHLGRDFADAVLMAEIVKFWKPSWVDLHNYNPANSRVQKRANWRLLNQKVLMRHLDIELPDSVIDRLVEGDTRTVESVLLEMKWSLERTIGIPRGGRHHQHLPPAPISLPLTPLSAHGLQSLDVKTADLGSFPGIPILNDPLELPVPKGGDLADKPALAPQPPPVDSTARDDDLERLEALVKERDVEIRSLRQQLEAVQGKAAAQLSSFQERRKRDVAKIRMLQETLRVKAIQLEESSRRVEVLMQR